MRIYLILFLLLFSCTDSGTNETKQVTEVVTSKVEYNMTDFLNDQLVPACFKEIYSGKLDPNANDSCAFCLIDSIHSQDKLRQPYYFLILTRSFEIADASYSEAVCNLSLEYIRNNTSQFLDQFLMNRNLTNHDLELWADNTMMELINFANDDATAAVASYIQDLQRKSVQLNNAQKEKLNELIKLMNNYYP